MGFRINIGFKGFIGFRLRNLGQPSTSSLDGPCPPSVHWKYRKYLDPEILDLPRLPCLWRDIIARKDIFKLAMPELSVGKSPGTIFAYAENMVEMVPPLYYDPTFLLGKCFMFVG